MGFKVEWDEDRRQVTINKDRINSLLNIDQDAYNVARDYRQLGTAPEIINDITYVPINFINEILNASVEYTQTHILINTQEDSSYPYTYGESETQTDDIFILERLTEDYTDAGDINLQ
jgi:hypothetical protein